MKKIIIFILCIILGVVAFILVNKISEDNKMKNDSGNNKIKESSKNNEEEIINKEEIIVPNNTNSSFKLINTFKEENNNRYIEYKNNNPELSDEEIVMRVNVYLDYAFYQNDISALNKNTPLILVNKYYYIDDAYVPNNLVEISTNYASGGGIFADSEATDNFMLMCNDAKVLGLTIKTISAYRTFDYQKALYNGYLKNDSVANVDTYSARPGHSEHQTGYAFDVYNADISYTSFGDTEEFKWVKINAHKYGFIIRYTEANSYITGYNNEPWHLRYVGVDAATYINENNITLEEYLLNKK